MELAVERLTKRYPGKTALNHVSFTLHEGITGLIGPNGAGKSTLLCILAGVLSASDGRVLWNGKDIAVLGERYRAILGFQPQMPALYKDFRAEEFLRYMAAVKGLKLSRKETDRLVSDTLEKVGLSLEGRGKIGSFSGGMCQRLSIAQALLNSPKLLLLDEPTAGLDPGERIRLKQTVQALSDRTIVLWSTHIIADLQGTAQGILMLNQGRMSGLRMSGDADAERFYLTHFSEQAEQK